MITKTKALLFALFLFMSISILNAQEIPIENLTTRLQNQHQQFSNTILANEIKGITVEQFLLTGEKAIKDKAKKGYKTIYLFYKGQGNVIAAKTNYDIVPETILLPQNTAMITVKSAVNDTLHYLKISSKLTEQDLIDLKDFPKENLEQVYYKKFTDCQPYTEPIKSPNTISRTILPNKFIPRIAMGTVQTKGPDKVGAHSHPMLEQLFLGLTNNDIVVYADEAKVNLPQYSLLHIPLGSSHSVTVDENKIMYYVWMDFFRDKKGEEWLKTHNTDNKK